MASRVGWVSVLVILGLCSACIPPPSALVLRHTGRLVERGPGKGRGGLTVGLGDIGDGGAPIVPDLGYRVRVAPAVELDASAYTAFLAGPGVDDSVLGSMGRFGANFRFLATSRGAIAGTVGVGVGAVHTCALSGGSCTVLAALGFDTGFMGSARLGHVGDLYGGLRLAPALVTDGDGAAYLIWLTPAFGIRLHAREVFAWYFEIGAPMGFDDSGADITFGFSTGVELKLDGKPSRR